MKVKPGSGRWFVHALTVGTVESLEKELAQPTYQYRYINVQFDLSDDEFYRYNALAKKVGAVLIRNVERIYAL